jgi:uroporphyrinogen decarboxylase
MALTSKERIDRMFEHREADRVPIVDVIWAGTRRRWIGEGMPAQADWREYLGVDKWQMMYHNCVDHSMRLERRAVEETDRYVISVNGWGVTEKRFKELDSTPEYLDFTIRDARIWNDPNAILPRIEHDIPILREKGGFMFGSDHSIPNSVSLSDMRSIVAAVKRSGSLRLKVIGKPDEI